MTEEATVSEELHVDLRAVGDRSDAAPERRYNRVLLKLSGEVFGGGQVGLDPDVVRGDRRADRRGGRAPASRSRSSSVAATSSAAPSCRRRASTGPGPTTWACSAS